MAGILWKMRECGYASYDLSGYFGCIGLYAGQSYACGWDHSDAVRGQIFSVLSERASGEMRGRIMVWTEMAACADVSCGYVPGGVFVQRAGKPNHDGSDAA